MTSKQDEELIFNVNDTSAKRFGKAKYTDHLLTNKFFDDFKNKYPQYKKKKRADFIEDWSRIIDGMMDILLDEPDGIQLSNGMGEMKLGLLKVHNVIDKKASAEAGKPIKYINSSTNRKPGKLVWSAKYAKIINFFLGYLGFTGCRNIRTQCKEIFKKEGNKFKDVTGKHKFIK